MKGFEVFCISFLENVVYFGIWGCEKFGKEKKKDVEFF